MLRLFILSICTVTLLCVAVAADATQITARQRAYHAGWLETAKEAESTLKTGRASNAELEQLRLEIVGYRDRFNEIRSGNGERIKTLEDQLAALGPAPKEGETEAEDIASLRERLTEQLDSVRVPRVIAEEAYSRADGLIGEIDNAIWDHTKKELLTRGPSPLNLVLWRNAYVETRQSVLSLYREMAGNLQIGAVREQAQNRFPAIVALMVLGVFLIFKGKTWSDLGGDYLRSIGGAGSGVWTFLVSLARILIPWIGVVLIVTAVTISGVPGLRGTLLLQQIPYVTALFLYLDWVRRQIVGYAEIHDPEATVVKKATEYRLLVGGLALALVLYQFVLLFEKIENPTDGTRAVISFPLIVVIGLILWRLMRLRVFPNERTKDQDDDIQRAGFSRVIRATRRVVFLLGILSPILAALGYVAAAEAIIFPAVKTLALIATLVILHRFAASVYGWVSGKGEAASDTLAIIVVGFALALLSVPALALIWGARAAELAEIWSQILRGVDVGGITISPKIFMVFVIVFAIGYSLTKLLQSGLRNSLLPKTRMDPGGQSALVAGVGYVGVFITALIAIVSAGIDLTALGYVAGALSVGIGFGLQNIVSNFVSGIILLIERPIAKDDWIDVNGQMGYVRDISVRSTRIETFDRTDVIVPNSDLISGTVTNFTRGNTVGRVIVPVGVAYGTDTRKVEAILLEVANGHPMVLAHPAPSVVFQGFGADSLDFEIRAILRDVNWVLSVKSDMNHEIARRFAEEGFEIPFAQRDIWLRNPEVLSETSDGAPATTPVQQSAPMGLSEADMGDGDDL